MCQPPLTLQRHAHLDPETPRFSLYVCTRLQRERYSYRGLDGQSSIYTFYVALLYSLKKEKSDLKQEKKIAKQYGFVIIYLNTQNILSIF